jgi:hypothetical protein
MSWEEIKIAFNYLLIGFVIGYLWHPIWTLGKRVVEEAKLAREQWRQPRG